ncbi:hypothetical protein [Paludibacterium purpuratum]|uniref:EspA-like secreted protein n=1 Tax=Paludibacterium purpuratum TaxID=1144873 RepID=A0A4R7B3P2_9NEIS|nr:hypothetical protein [Paludibacterium purpuratum]TDR76640.1 EspA-like secreted protein [Paludibacterium purpuratum]
MATAVSNQPNLAPSRLQTEASSPWANGYPGARGMLNPFLLYAKIMQQAAELNQVSMEQLNDLIDAQNTLARGAGEKAAELLALQKGMANPAKDTGDLPPGIDAFFDANGLKVSAKDKDGKVVDMSLNEYLKSIGKEKGKDLSYAELDRIRSALEMAKEQASSMSNRLTAKAQTYLSNYNNAFQAASNAIKSCGENVSGIIRNCS